MKPAAGRLFVNNLPSGLIFLDSGSLGIVTQPARGLWKSMQQSWASHQNSQVRQTRVFQGAESVKACSDIASTKTEILERFERAKKTVNERREALKAEARAFVESGGGLSLESENDPSTSRSQAQGFPVVQPPPVAGIGPTSDVAVAEQSPAAAAVGDAEEAAFQRDLAHAVQLSMTEQETSGAVQHARAE